MSVGCGTVRDALQVDTLINTTNQGGRGAQLGVHVAQMLSELGDFSHTADANLDATTPVRATTAQNFAQSKTPYTVQELELRFQRSESVTQRPVTQLAQRLDAPATRLQQRQRALDHHHNVRTHRHNNVVLFPIRTSPPRNCALMR